MKSEFLKFKYSYFRYEKGKYVISYCGPYKEKEIMKSKWFDEYKYVPFENTHIRICSEWNMYLEHLYGDYMTLPPVGQRVSHHAHYYLNLDKGMTREEIINKVAETLSEEFEVEQDVITPDAVIYDTLDLDSLSLVDLVAVVQYTFKVKIPVSDLPSVKTFNDLYDYIESHQ